MLRSTAPNKAAEIASNKGKLRTIDMRSAGAPIRQAISLCWAGCVLGLIAQAHAQQPAPMQAGGLAPPPPMQTGGLAPPPPGSGPPPPAPAYPAYPNAAQRQLEDAEHNDSGRGLEFVYVDVGGGGQFVSLDALGSSGSLLPPAGKASAFGPYFSAAAGIRLLFLTVGPSFRFGTFTDWDLWTLNLELGWHIPLGNLEPYAQLGGGFAKLGYHESAFGTSGAPNASTTGFDIRLAGGVDYYVSNVFSVGGTLQAELLRLSRDKITDAAGTVIASDASSVGLVITAGAVVGLHF
jgi:hypothetical protein